MNKALGDQILGKPRRRVTRLGGAAASVCWLFLILFFLWMEKGWSTVREERMRTRVIREASLKINGQFRSVKLVMDRHGSVVSVKGPPAPALSWQRDAPGADPPGIPRMPGTVRALSVEQGSNATVVYRSKGGGHPLEWYRSALTQLGWTLTPLSDQSVWAEQNGSALYLVEVVQSGRTFVVMVLHHGQGG